MFLTSSVRATFIREAVYSFFFVAEVVAICAVPGRIIDCTAARRFLEKLGSNSDYCVDGRENTSDVYHDHQYLHYSVSHMLRSLCDVPGVPNAISSQAAVKFTTAVPPLHLQLL